MSEYIIMKLSRTPVRDIAHEYDAYMGPSCEEAGVDKGQIYTDLDLAIADCDRLLKVNGVGWAVWKIGMSYPVWYSA